MSNQENNNEQKGNEEIQKMNKNFEQSTGMKVVQHEKPSEGKMDYAKDKERSNNER